MFMSLQPSPWPDTTKLCSGEGQEILIDGGAHGEVRSKTGIIALFQQRNDGFAYVRSRGTPRGHPIRVSRAVPQPLTGAKRFKMGRPPHNSGLRTNLSERNVRAVATKILSGKSLLYCPIWKEKKRGEDLSWFGGLPQLESLFQLFIPCDSGFHAQKCAGCSDRMDLMVNSAPDGHFSVSSGLPLISTEVG